MHLATHPTTASRDATCGAEIRARDYRTQSDQLLRQAEAEPLEQRRRILLAAAARLTRLAEGEERVALGRNRTARPQALSAS